MAQQDTGMGWSAESSYLIQNAGVIVGSTSVFGGPSYPGQPIPKNITAPGEIITGGMKMIDYDASIPSDPDTYTLYCAAEANYDVLAFSIANSQNTIYGFITKTQNARVNVLSLNNNSGQYSVNPFTLSYAYRGFYISSISTILRNPTVYIPVFSSLDDAIDHVIVSTNNITKTNAGYAVACMAKWHTPNGVVITSPILISSNTEYTDMAFNDPNHSIAKLNMLLHGVRFYMAFFDLKEADSVSSTMPMVDLLSRGDLTLDQVFMTIISTSYAHIIIHSSPDPYEQESGGSTEEGGDGEDLEDDDVGIEDGSDFPSAINTGFCRIYTPSESDLQNLSNYLWSNSYDLAQVKKLFSNPMDSILGLSAVPIRLLGSSVNFSLGGVPITGMTLPLVNQQRYTYDMGAITIKERWGSYLDYDPYTKFSIFLPFIGMRNLSADDIMGKTVGLMYDIDILTGMCVARLQAGTNCLYEWGGNCAIQLPINSRNWDSVFSTAVSAVGGIMSAVTGGSAPLIAGSVASAALQTVSMKPHIDKASAIGGAAGWLGQMTPYIIRTTPEAYIPADQNKFIGYPAYINVSLGTISGYNEVESIHLENVTATGAELEEIESILKGGVIF